MRFELAAAGHDMASKNRAHMAETMSATRIAEAEARARAWRAAHP